MSTFKERIAWLEQQYWSPLAGLRDVMAADLLRDWGYDPDQHPVVLDALDEALCEAILETGYEVMREHGLKGPVDSEQPRSGLPNKIKEG